MFDSNANHEALSRLLDRVDAKVGYSEHADDDLSKLTEPERVFWYLFGFDLECLNGGVLQFLTNSTGNLFYEVMAAFRTIGDHYMVNYLRAVEEVFGEPLSRNRAKRNKQVDRLTPEQCDLIEYGVETGLGNEGKPVDIASHEPLLLNYLKKFDLVS